MSKLIELAGHPHIHCNRCRVDVVWPVDLSAREAAKFAAIARTDRLDGLRYAENLLGLGPREAKVLALHITRVQGFCSKCNAPVTSREPVCKCRSANLDW